MSERRPNLAACLIAVVVLAVVCVLAGWGLAIFAAWLSQTQEPEVSPGPESTPAVLVRARRRVRVRDAR